MRFFRCVLIYDCVFHVILSGPSCVFLQKRFIPKASFSKSVFCSKPYLQYDFVFIFESVLCRLRLIIKYILILKNILATMPEKTTVLKIRVSSKLNFLALYCIIYTQSTSKSSVGRAKNIDARFSSSTLEIINRSSIDFLILIDA